jgi:hypothetical protein
MVLGAVIPLAPHFETQWSPPQALSMYYDSNNKEVLKR